MMNYWIGIDWGGTRVKLGVVTAGGELLQHRTLQSPADQAIDHRVDAILKQTSDLIDAQGAPAKGIGLALTGPVDPDFGVVYLPGKIRGLEQYPIVQRFRERFGIAVSAENDGKLAMYAERAIGLARDVEWATVITIGTGVGSGILIAGQIIDDPNFMFGTQLGHVVQNSSYDQLCLTGARGTAEMLCSATALALAVRGGLQRGIPSTLSEPFLRDPMSIDFRMIIEQGVEKGDLLCTDEFQRWTRNVAWLCVNAVHAYSSQRIILSGGATLAARHFLPQLQQHVNGHTFRYPRDRIIPIVISPVQEHAGVIGAALMCRQRHSGKEVETHD